MKSYEVKVDQAALKVAADFGAKPAIHISDPEYNTLLVQNGNNVGTASQVYYKTGQAKAVAIRDLIARHQGAQLDAGLVTSPMSILVFGSRFGHVSRHLVRLFPNAKIIALGFEEPEMYFHQNDLSIEASHAGPDANLANAFFKFDVVVAPHFFCHVPKIQMVGWLTKSMEFMSKNGLAITAFQGPLALSRRFPKGTVFDRNGIISPLIVPSTSPSGMDFAETLVRPSAVFEMFEKTRTRVIEFAEGYWDSINDLYVARKLI